MKTNPTTRPSADRTCTQTLAGHCGSVFFSNLRCLMASVRPAQSALHRTWKKQMQITQRIYGVWEAPIHADNNMAFVLKTSTRLVNGSPMLLICAIVGEPPIPSLANRALYHLNEALANFCLLIASSPICHHPCFSRVFNV